MFNEILCVCVNVHTGMTAEEVDIILQRSEGGVDTALAYAKTISKYMKDLISYVEKRTALGGYYSMFHWRPLVFKGFLSDYYADFLSDSLFTLTHNPWSVLYWLYDDG